MTKRTIIVTGAAGFIGSHLCEALLKEGHEVLGIDNYLSGNRKNTARLEQYEQFELFEHDVRESFELDKIPSQIYNLACPASPVDYTNMPIETLLTSAFGTHVMLELARKHHTSFLQASTSEVYGDPLEHPQKESYWGNVNPVGPRACYDEGKRFAEALVTFYRKEYKADTRIARIFNTYGPRMRLKDGRVIPTLMFQGIKEHNMTVYGEGKQTRSFCYVSDMVDGLIALMNSHEHEPVNLGNPEEVTILELAEKIKEMADSKSKIVLRPNRPEDPERRKPDISKAKKLLGWKPRVSLDKGLKATMEWFRENI